MKPLNRVVPTYLQALLASQCPNEAYTFRIRTQETEFPCSKARRGLLLLRSDISAKEARPDLHSSKEQQYRPVTNCPNRARSLGVGNLRQHDPLGPIRSPMYFVKSI
jgi:hypothetical protein